MHPAAACHTGLSTFGVRCDPYRYYFFYTYERTADLTQDLQLKNLLLPAPDQQTLHSFEEAAAKAPSARKILKDRTIYTSSRFPPSNGIPLLSDFGEARFGDQEHDEDIMPNVYRAPEVILKMKWDYKVDIWNVAMVVSGLFLLTDFLFVLDFLR